MNGTIDIDTQTTDGEGGLDPRQAAELLRETREHARRDLDLTSPPLIALIGAPMFLLIYGGLYMAARGEHPYTGPKGPWLLVWPVGVILALAINGTRYDRVKRTLSGATLRRVRASGAALAVGLIGIYAVDAALAHAGAGKNIIYGVFDASGPLVVMGSIGAANCAWREDWTSFGASLGIILVAAGAAFAGPAGSWGVIGIGGCIVCLATGAARIYERNLQRRDG
jgi:hypothetical protein